MTSDFTTGTTETRRHWNNISYLLKENSQYGILYLDSSYFCDESKYLYKRFQAKKRRITANRILLKDFLKQRHLNLAAHWNHQEKPKYWCLCSLPDIYISLFWDTDWELGLKKIPGDTSVMSNLGTTGIKIKCKNKIKCKK